MALYKLVLVGLGGVGTLKGREIILEICEKMIIVKSFDTIGISVQKYYNENLLIQHNLPSKINLCDSMKIISKSAEVNIVLIGKSCLTIQFISQRFVDD
jgi:hypothetical protein